MTSQKGSDAGAPTEEPSEEEEEKSEACIIVENYVRTEAANPIRRDARTEQ